MNHFNFFSTAQKDKKAVNYPLISGILAASSLLIVLVMFLSAKIELLNAQNQLDYLTGVENNPAFILRYSMDKELQKQLTSATDNYVFLRTVDLMAENGSTVDGALVKNVLDFFPSGTKVFKMTVSHDELVVDGVASSLDTMIGVEKKMNKSDLFSSVFITTAKQDSHAEDNGKNAVTFNCRLTLTEKGEETK